MSTKSDTHTPVEYVIEPPKGLADLNLFELVQYRDLIYFFLLRQVTIRYKQTILGPFWVVLTPLLSMVIYSFLFGTVARLPSNGIPYPIFAYSALVVWYFFSNGVGAANGSLVANAAMVKKVYFPRLLLPLVSVLTGAIDLLINFGILLLMMAAFGYFPTINVIWLPFFVLLAGITALGIGLLLAGLNVLFRDVGYFVSYLTRFWLYATPVVYARETLPETLQMVMFFNPMTPVAEGFRWALLGVGDAPTIEIIFPILISVGLLFAGLVTFKRLERYFVDVV